MSAFTRLALAFSVLATAATGGALAAVATFDDLLTPPPLNSATGLFFANGDSADYAGATWDSRFTVVGDLYRVDPGTPGPLFGLPHSGHYLLTNDGVDNDGMSIATTQVLTGAWFGRNEYYGFGGGADRITVHALSGAVTVGSVEFDLPELLSGEPEVLSFVDTSVFRSLAGITGYRINRRELGQQSGNWVADDFSFESPRGLAEAPTLALLGLAGLLAFARRSRRR